MNIAGELLAAAAQREARQIDEKLFFEIFAARPGRPGQGRSTAARAMTQLPVEPAWRLAHAPPSNAGSSTACGPTRRSASSAASPSAASPSSPSTWRSPSLRHPLPAPLHRAAAGRVLLYAAEDALHVVRQRLEGICAAAGCRLADLDIHVITAPSLRLDLPADRRPCEHTVAQLRPRLLILDPFVRLHRIDENATGEVAPLLAYLRELQRRHALSVLVVHHAKKPPPASAPARPCAAPPSSTPGATPTSTCAAAAQALSLTIEHRAAPSPPSVELQLQACGEALALHLAPTPPAPATTPSSLDERIATALQDAARPLTISELRSLCRVRNTTLYQRLAALINSGKLLRTADGYQLTGQH